MSRLRDALALLCLLVPPTLARSSSLLDVSPLPDLKQSSSLPAVERMLDSSSLEENNGKPMASTTLLGAMTEESGQISLRRRLALGDFDSFNELFKSAVLRLPDADLSTDVIGINLGLGLTNLRCTNIQIGDIIIAYNRTSSERMTYQANIVDLDILCDLDYEYSFGFLGGEGSCRVTTADKDANALLAFTSKNFDLDPNTNSTVETCNANINAVSFSFSGGDFVGAILDTFEFLIRDTVESLVGQTICDELTSLGDSTIQDLFNVAAETLEPNLTPLTLQTEDLLAAENSLQVPDGVALVDFRDTESVIGSLLDTVLSEAGAFLSSSPEDAGGLNSTGNVNSTVGDLAGNGNSGDLGINAFLRDFLLDENRALSLNVSDLPLGTDGVIYEGQDDLLESKISIDAVKIFGLDTFTKFEALSPIGSYTLRNELSWEYLNVQLEMTMDIRPSTKNESVLENPDEVDVVEKIKIEFGLDNVDAVASLLLAINQDAIGSLRIGSLLDFSTLAPCLMPVLFASELTGLDVSIANVREPTLDGFASAGIDRVLSQSVEALFSRYETILLKAMPGLFHNVVRDLINESFLKSLSTSADVKDCPLVDFGDNDLIDFRDLLLDPNLAASFGGSGIEPYGSIAPSIMTLVQDQITSLDESGLPSINSFLIRPLTKSQSGIEGSLVFPDELFGIGNDSAPSGLLSPLFESIKVSLSNARIQNLDTVVAPLSILQPSSEPYVLTNLINIGPVPGKLLNGTITFLLSFGDDSSSPFSLRDEIDVSASIMSSTVSAELLARLATNGLMQFPLRDVTNLSCWLSIFAGSGSGATSSFAVTSMLLSLSSLSLDAQCVSCTSVGFQALPTVIDKVEETGAFTMLSARLESLVYELLTGQFIESQFDRLLKEAPKSCPHRPEFDKDATAPSNGLVDFPDLSSDSIESILYASALLIQIAAIGVTKSYASYDPTTSDYLSGQKAMDVPEGTQLLDLTALEETIGGLVGTGIEDLNSYLDSRVDDLGGPNGDSDLGVNVQLRSLLLDSNRALSISLDNIEVVAGKTTVALDELRILGLDTFTSFEALDLAAPQTVRNKFSWDQLRIELDISVSSESTMPDPNVVTVSFGMQQVDASVSLLAALDQELLGSLEFGSLMNTAHIIPCLLSTAFAMELTELVVSVSGVDWLSMEGLISDELDSALSNVSKALMNVYGDRIVAAIPGVFDVAIRGMINNWIKSYMDLDTSVSCPDPEFDSLASGIVDFRDMFLDPKEALALGGSGLGQYGNLVRDLHSLLNDLILRTDPEDGTSGVNDFLIGPLTADTGMISFTNDLLNTGREINAGGLSGLFELKLHNFRVENLDTIGDPLSLLNPVDASPYLLNNTLSFGATSEPLRFGLTLLIGFDGPGSQIHNEVDISVDLPSATIVLGVLIKILEDRVASFPLRDLPNLSCWLATLPTPALDPRGIRQPDMQPSAALTDLAISISSIGLNVECISCSGPDMEEFTKLMSSPDTSHDAVNFANNILDTATRLLSGDFLQVQIDRLLAEAPRNCPHRDEYEDEPAPAVYQPFDAVDSDEDSTGFLIALAALAGGLLVLVVILMYVIRLVVRRRHRKWLRSLPDHSIVMLHRHQKEEAEREAELNRMTKSMFQSKAVPFYVRGLVPVIILGNIALFLSGHLSRGGSVSIVADVAGQQLTVENFYEFSIARSTMELWDAGGKEVAFLILIFSGVWPYTKQLISLALWFLPPRVISVSRRGSIFLWLDALGKWSMIDIFVLVVTIAAFRITIESPDVSFLPDGFYSISLLVVPMWGLYANMTAQLVSQVSSHFIIHYHRRIVRVAMEEHEQDQSPAHVDTLPSAESLCSNNNLESVLNLDTHRGKLCDHAFARPHRGQSDKLRVRRVVNPLLAFAVLLLSGLVIMGCVFPSFSIEVFGVLGVAVESGQGFEEAKTFHNIFTLVQLLMDEAKFLGSAGDYIGLGTLSVLMIVTVLVVPLVQSLLLLHQWFFPMGDRAHFRTRVAIEILQAWQYMEVYVITVILSTWQLGPISEFMINPLCRGLSSTFASLVFYGILDENDAQCFSIKAEVEDGFFMLIAASLMLALFSSYVTRAFIQFQRDKSKATLLHDDRKLLENSADSSEENVSKLSGSIHPAPVLFTDTFRWTLRREDVHVMKTSLRLSQQSSSGLDKEAKVSANSVGPHESKPGVDIESGCQVGVAVGLLVNDSSDDGSVYTSSRETAVGSLGWRQAVDDKPIVGISDDTSGGAEDSHLGTSSVSGPSGVDGMCDRRIPVEYSHRANAAPVVSSRRPSTDTSIADNGVLFVKDLSGGVNIDNDSVIVGDNQNGIAAPVVVETKPSSDVSTS